MKLKILITAGIITAMMTAPAYAAEISTAHDLAQEYLDYSENVEKVDKPIAKKVVATCYTESGKRTATGSTKQSGIVAARVEDLGAIAVVYKVGEDGGIGEYIGSWTVEDVGYGASTRQGSSDIKPGRSEGDIESGDCLDFRHSTYAECVRFMKATQTGEGRSGSQVWVQLIKGNG